MESLVVCKRCEGNACLNQKFKDNSEAWMCFGCGFTTSTQMIEGSDLVHNMKNTLPELYQDLLFIDEDKRVWAPSTLTLPGKGIVFLDGTGADDWHWAGALSVEIKEEERERFPQDQTHKIDFSTKKSFHQKDFMDALEYIEFFNIN
jgi:hypothetical protein